MKPSEVFAQYRDTIRDLVLQSGMTNPRVFGSVLHGDDIEGSDLDILIDVPPRTSLFDIIELELALEKRTGMKLHLLTPEDLPPRFRGTVLAEAAAIGTGTSFAPRLTSST